MLDHTLCCSLFGRLDAFIGPELDTTPLSICNVGLLMDVTALIVALVGPRLVIVAIVASVSAMLIVVPMVPDGGRVADSEEEGVSIDKAVSDCKFDCGPCNCGVKANLNFFRCLFACFKCSRLAWARRRKTKESGVFCFGLDISFVHLILSSNELIESE